MAVITLLSDFGVDDEYIGVMKGVILSICPGAAIVDITHRIDPQDIAQAAYLLPSCYQYFPAGTIHIVVVDPGVGGERNILAVHLGQQLFITLDNGILTLLLNAEKSDRIIRVTNTDYFLKPLSSTFHGRDIFAALGAHLASGIRLEELGTEIAVSEIVHLENLGCRISESNELVGKIVRIDRFGNLITNIDSIHLNTFLRSNASKLPQIHIGSSVIGGLSKTYAEMETDAPLALIGSRNYLEIAVNCGNAQEHFKARKGDSVRVNLL